VWMLTWPVVNAVVATEVTIRRKRNLPRTQLHSSRWMGRIWRVRTAFYMNKAIGINSSMDHRQADGRIWKWKITAKLINQFSLFCLYSSNVHIVTWTLSSAPGRGVGERKETPQIHFCYNFFKIVFSRVLSKLSKWYIQASSGVDFFQWVHNFPKNVQGF